MRESTLNSTEKQEKLPLIGEKEILEWSQKQLTKTEIIPLDKTVLAYGRDKKGNLILVKKINEKMVATRKDGVRLWQFNEHGEAVFNGAHELPVPYVHMLATSSNYFSISDQFLRGFAGFDYTRMFGEFDGQNFPKDQGRVVWVRLSNQALWCANYAPQRSIEPSSFKTTFGLGSVTLENETQAVGLKAKLTLFVPTQDKVELLLGEITNISDEEQTIDVIPTIPIFGGSRAYVEYHRDVVRLYNKSEHDKSRSAILIKPGLEWVEGSTDASDITYFMKAMTESGKPGSQFYSDRESFLGPHFQWREPLSLAAKLPARSPVLGKEAVGAIEFSKITLKPNETFKFVVVTGIGFTQTQAEEVIQKYSYATAVQEKQKLEQFWLEQTSQKQIHSQDPNFDTSWNKWWFYQLCMRYWFGNTAHPQFDYGTDFSGWREIWQDMIGIILLNPDKVKEHILKTLEGIRTDGTNATRFFARTKEFGSDEINGLWCDHPYWTTQAIWVYVQQSGHLDFFLQDGIKYFKDLYISRGEGKDENWPKGTIGRHTTKNGKEATGTVLEHLLTQILPMYFDAGKNGLLRIKRADWNDAVDQTKGESTTFSMGLVQDLKDLARILEELKKRKGITTFSLFEELAELLGNNNLSVEKRNARLQQFLSRVDQPLSGKKKEIAVADLIADLKEKAKIMTDLINEKAWNGKSYIGYFYADGAPVDNLFLMPHSFAIFSGVAEGERLEKMIASVNQYLFNAKNGGYKLNAPAYTKFNKKIGRITGFAPGTKENNAIFNHANLFWMYAMLRLGRCEAGAKAWQGVNPLNHEQTEALIPPFLPEYWISEDNTHLAGKGEYPMLTGTAVWTRILFEQWVLGIRGELDGLRITPCLPATKQWQSCGIDTPFRGARYQIRIKNPKLIENGKIKSMLVDGKKIEGNLLQPFSGGTHTVEAVLE